MSTRRSLLKRGALLATIPALALPLVVANAPGSPAGATFGSPFGDRYFERIATFPVFENNPDRGDETVAEIIDYWEKGEELVYTDAEIEQVGFIDISDPDDPQPAGTVELDGEPTSVSVAARTWFGVRRDYALVGVNTSESLVNPSGHLAVIDLRRKEIVEKIDIGGQPDSVKVSPTGRYAAIAVENERDEDIVVDGVEGGLPQAPPGFLKVVRLRGNPDRWRTADVDLTGLSEYAPDDPEPEFVDINRRDQAVVSLQENNHVVVVNLRNRRVIQDFDAGAVDLDGVDVEENRLIEFDGSLDDVPREPDAIAWVGNTIATANEGDLFGGSRGFSLFRRNGNVIFDAGSSFDERARSIGHYNEERSENKGSEPESITFDRYGFQPLLFVGSERGSFVDVYTGALWGKPQLLQSLPTGLGPEGLLTIPKRNLFVVSSEVDDPELGVRATVMIYRYGAKEPAYPQVESDDIGWSAMSGMAAKQNGSNEAYAVWDSFYAESKVFTLDLGQTPAQVVDHANVTKDGENVGYDLEGIALRSDGGFWAASEGAVTGGLSTTDNLLIRLDENFAVQEEIGLPEEFTACREAAVQLARDVDDENSAEYARARGLRFGFEGVTELPDGRVVVPQQRGWQFGPVSVPGLVDDCRTLQTNTGSNEGDVGRAIVWIYDPASGEWEAVRYELDPRPAEAAWVGLSEATWIDDGSDDGAVVFIERDNRTGVFASVKTLTKVAVEDFTNNIVDEEQAVYDLLPDMNATNGWISDKPEGTAIFPGGETFVITDNDGVDDWSGETQLLRLGNVDGLFS